GSGREGVQFCAGSVPTIFSMHATKAFAIGEGGLIYSHDDELVERMRRITNFGFDSSRSSVDVGINAKLSEILAAVALTTLDQFEAKSIERKQLYELYETGLKQMPDWQLQDLRGGTVAHQFLSVLTPTALGGSSVQARLLRLGVEARTYFNPACHQQRVFADCPRGDLGVSESVASRVLSLPLWEGMTEKTVGRVLEALK
ncbi:MAG: DegT/DnrJ/EryC1/StrS family aminotransferase, partial [Cryobacterium sp.]|nr:DegT/DnrJ/EryC1/StrS family aminotransferase [Cryobacterium sp.]